MNRTEGLIVYFLAINATFAILINSKLKSILNELRKKKERL